MENSKIGKLHKQRKSIKKININAKFVAESVAVTVLAFVLGQGTLFQTLSPFGFALIMSVPGINSLFALMGTSLGLAFSQVGVYLFRYVICAVALWVIKSRVLNSRSRIGDVWFVGMGVTFLVCFLTGIAVTLPTRGGFDEIIMFFAEGVIAGISVFFYKRTALSILKTEEKAFSGKDLPFLCLSFATVVAALAEINFFGFSPAFFLSFFAVTVMSHLLSAKGGGFVACAAAAALSSALPDGYNVLPLMFSGVVAGIFSPLGKAGTSLSFILTFAATSFFTDDISLLQQLITAAVTTGVFLAIPEKLYRRASVFLRENKAGVQESMYRKDVSHKLLQTAQTVASICDGMNKVSENLKKIDSGCDKNIFCRVRQEVCTECENKEKCWSQSFQYTLRGFEELSKNYRDENELSDTPFGKLFLGKCLKGGELQASLKQNFRKYDEKLKEEIRLDEKRKLMSDQMYCMSSVLKDFSKDFSRCALVDNEMSASVKEIFNSFSIRCTKALCIIGTEGNMTVKASCKKIDRDIDRKKLKEEIEKLSLRKFSDPEIDFTDAGTVVTFRQRPWMKMKVGKIQLSSEESPICGDCLREYSDEFGNKTIILADGMGTGGRAAVDAAIAAEYFGGLVENSVSFDNALKIVNSVLDLKSANESLATIDAARFNLFSGKVEFYKAGAAVSFVRKNGKCSAVESASLPAGILSDVYFAKEKFMLSKGDIVVMVSDGVTNGKIDWIAEEIESFNKSNPDILAQKIAGTVCDKSHGERRDDITVVVGIMTA